MQGRVSDHVVNTLAKLMAEAKAGYIDAVAVIVVSPDGRPAIHFGGAGDLTPSVYLGAGLLKATIEQQALNVAGATQMNSGLVVPGHG